MEICLVELTFILIRSKDVKLLIQYLFIKTAFNIKFKQIFCIIVHTYCIQDFKLHVVSIQMYKALYYSDLLKHPNFIYDVDSILITKKIYLFEFNDCSSTQTITRKQYCSISRAELFHKIKQSNKYLAWFSKSSIEFQCQLQI